MEHADAHTDFETLCAGYVLDALSDEEAAQFEAMLREATPEQRALYEDMKLIHGDLALATEAHDPPAHVEAGIMASIQEDVRSTPPPTRSDRAAVQRGAGIPTWVYQGAAVALLLAVIGVGIWATQLRTTVQQQQATITQLEDEVAQQDELLAVLAAREARLVSMGGLDPSPEGYGKVLWAPEQRRAVFQIANVPAPPEDKDYQLWFIKDDESPVSAGVFHFNESSEELFFVVDELTAAPSSQSNTFAVTLEPKGGMPQPTGDMFLLGQQT
jgi:anti-sigma-K factor RskA